MSTRSLGQQYEAWVCEQLLKQGYRIMTTNFRSPYGEIDIIAIHNDTLVFVEVKARSSTLFGQPYEAVNGKKLQKITRTGQYYRQHTSAFTKLPAATRIDVVSVMIGKKGVKNLEMMQNVTR